MKLICSLLTLLHFINASPLSTPTLSPSQNRKLFYDVAQELTNREAADPHKPRIILYTQHRAQTNGEALSLLPLIEQKTGVTHVIVSSLHIHDLAGNINLNDDPPHSPKYDDLWKETRILQAQGIKVMVMVGGAAAGSYSKQTLGGNDTVFQAHYESLLGFLRRYSFDGIDLDIEEFIDMDVPLRLLKALHRDMGPSFILTMAPVAIALEYNDAINLSGFNYFDLDTNATDASGKPLVNWYNAQFYSNFGDASTPNTYQWIMRKGWNPERVVMGVLTNSNDGNGFVETKQVVETVRHLRREFPGFGGVYGWDYFDAGMGEVDGGKEPWQWVQIIRDALYGWLGRRGLMKSIEVLYPCDLLRPNRERKIHAPPETEDMPNFWTDAIFLAQLKQLIAYIDIKAYFLLGSSWGGMLGSHLAAQRPEGLRKLVLANSATRKLHSVTNSLSYRAALPKDNQDVLTRYEKNDSTSDGKYAEAMTRYIKEHVCNVEPLPGDLVVSLSYA
ncbi:glycoside hydrolase superfamily [Bisporella sp. PMI_857]|nr:glycoside hydrolase superfamily [Bisporella sp. PMI_857]